MNVEEDFTLEEIAQISGSNAHFAAVKAWVELVDSGFGDGTELPINWDDKAAILKDGKNIVAIIVWRELKWAQSAWICLGWVHRDYRRRGLYRRLYTDVRQSAKSAGARYLEGRVNPNNQAILGSAQTMGRVQHGITLRDALD